VKPGIAIALTACAGGLVAMQAPINSKLGKAAGTFAAASISFLIGTAILIAITAVSGKGANLSEASRLPWYYFTGGALGAAYVTTVLVTVGTLGAGGVTAATITGQLTLSLAVDRFGWMGVEQRSISAVNLAGVVLLAAGVVLVLRD